MLGFLGRIRAAAPVSPLCIRRRVRAIGLVYQILSITRYNDVIQLAVCLAV